MAKNDKPEIIWHNRVSVGEVQLSEKTKLVVEVTTRDDIKYVNLRQWYQRRDSVWKPSLNGLCLGVEVPLKETEGAEKLTPIEPFIDLLEKCLVIAKDLPLYDEANVVYKMPKEDK